MAITYNAGTKVITITAGTEGAMNSLQDVYDASVAGGWGAMSKQGSTQFRFDNEVRLVIGDGSTTTWFGDTNKLIEISDLAGTGWQIFMEKKANANIRFGTIISGKRTKDGCAFYHSPSGNAFTLIDSNHTSGVIDFFSCAFYVTVTAIYNCTGVRFYNCIAVGDLRISDNVTLDIYNYSMNNGYMISQDSTGTYDKIYGSDITYVTYIGTAAADLTFKNVTVLNNTYVAKGYSTAKNIYMINFDVETWAFTYSTYSGKFYRQYEFDLILVDSAGSGISTVKVKIWDDDDAVVTNTTTDANGVLATQTLNYGYYDQSGGDVATMKTPHEIRIYKYGKSMLSSKSSIEKVTDWALTMLTDSYITQTTEATVAAYTGITINHTTETITISSNHTLDEIYDYCQYDIIAATKQIDQTMHTADGVNFVSEYSFVVNTGITVTATDQKLSMVSGETYTLTGTAQFTGIIATTTTTRIPIKLTNIIDGSRYWVGKESDGTKIFDGTQSGSGDVVGYYEHTANITIDIRVRKSSASVKYKPWVGEGTLSAEAFSLRIRQIQDSIIT